MHRQRVSSESIRSIGYDAGRQVLEVEFLHGGVYCYRAVPPMVHARFVAAPSKGRYFHAHIRGVYAFSRLPPSGGPVGFRPHGG